MSFSVQLTVIAVIYLVFYGWRVFVKDKGNPGGLGLVAAVMAWGQILSFGLDFY